MESARNQFMFQWTLTWKFVYFCNTVLLFIFLFVISQWYQITLNKKVLFKKRIFSISSHQFQHERECVSAYRVRALGETFCYQTAPHKLHVTLAMVVDLLCRLDWFVARCEPLWQHIQHLLSLSFRLCFNNHPIVVLIKSQARDRSIDCHEHISLDWWFGSPSRYHHSVA